MIQRASIRFGCVLQLKLKLIADSKYSLEEILQKQQEKNRPQPEEVPENAEDGSDDDGDSDWEQPECVSPFSTSTGLGGLLKSLSRTSSVFELCHTEMKPGGRVQVCRGKAVQETEGEGRKSCCEREEGDAEG